MVFYIYLLTDFLGQEKWGQEEDIPLATELSLRILLRNAERGGGGGVASDWYLAVPEEMQWDSPHSQSSTWTRIGGRGVNSAAGHSPACLRF